jgi:ATP-dependent helicase/nuclease subunit B
MSVPSNRIVLLPSSLAVSRERERLLENAPGGVLFGETVFTFERLFHRLAQDLDPGPPLLTPLGREMIAAEILAEGRFGAIWPGSHAGPGLRRRLLELLDHLKELGLSPEDLAEAARRAGAEQAFQKALGFYQAYETALKELGRTDRAGQRQRVLAALQDGTRPAFLKNVDEVLVRDFAFLTPYQAALTQALARVVDRVEVRLEVPASTLRPEAGDGPFEEIRRLVQDISRTTGGASSPFFSSGLENKEPPAPLAFALAHIFSLVPPAQPAPDPQGRLEILAAPGRYHEVETIGRRISRLLDDGLPPERIAVAFPDLSLYGQMVEDVFRRFHLPLFFRRGAPLAIQGPVRALLALMNLAGSHWEQAQVLDLLASSYLDLGLDLDVAEVRRLSREAGVTDERAGGGWRENLLRLVRNQPKENEAVQRLLAGLDRLRRLLAPLARPQTWSGFRRSATRILDAVRLREKVLGGERRFLERDAPALEGLLAALKELEEAAEAAGLAGRRLPPEEIARGLKQALTDRNVGERAPAGSGIMVLKIYDLHGLDVNVLFLGGLNEGEFPSPSAEGGFLADGDCRALNQAVGRSVLSTTAAAYRREELLFYQCLALVKTRLVLSYTRLDEEGRISVPSPLLDEVLRLFPPDFIQEEKPAPRPLPPLVQALSREEVVGGLSAALLAESSPDQGPGGPIEEVLAALLERTGETDRWQALVERARREQVRLLAGSEQDGGRVQEESLAPWLARLAEHEGAPLLPATLLEEYGSCPFSFWAGRILGLEGPAEVRDEISAMDEGTLFHEVLARYYGRLKNEHRLPLAGHSQEAETLRAVAEEVFSRAEARFAVGRRPLWRVKQEAVRRLLSRWLAQEQRRDDDFTPIHFEWSFGPGRAAPPFPAPFLGGGRLWFRGRVDQIDEAEGKLRVIDYKLSAGAERYRGLLKPEAVGRTSFQAPIYQLAVAAALGRPCQATFYLLRSLERLKPLPSSETELFAADLEKRRAMAAAGEANFYNQVEETWSKVTQGRFPAEPEHENSCDFCAFQLACRAAAAEETP